MMSSRDGDVDYRLATCGSTDVRNIRTDDRASDCMVRRDPSRQFFVEINQPNDLGVLGGEESLDPVEAHRPDANEDDANRLIRVF
jgi:hypothetical protein